VLISFEICADISVQCREIFNGRNGRMVTSKATLMFGDTVAQFKVPDESFVNDFFRDLTHNL